MNCQVAEYSRHHIDMEFLENNLAAWRMSCFYGLPERTRRRESWDLIRMIAAVSSLPWCIWGDFNDLLYMSDKKGKNKHPQWLINGFKAVLEECHISELALNGGKFTWERGRGTNEWIREKLDRAFATDGWWAKFPLHNLQMLHTSVSDHEPLKLEFLKTDISNRKFRFRFENI